MAVDHDAVGARWSRRRILAAASDGPTRQKREQAE
jgi:hypothetical protein